MNSEKQKLRSHIRNLLKKSSCEQKKQASRNICRHLAENIDKHPEWKKIATFASLETEPNLEELCLIHSEREWLFPLVGENSSLSFHLVSDLQTLTPGHYGILEPNPLVHPLILEKEIDLVLCPGIAFTTQGVRLGQGGGFYDRFLPLLRPHCSLIGVCFDSQILASLPQEDHDWKMQQIASERLMVSCA